MRRKLLVVVVIVAALLGRTPAVARGDKEAAPAARPAAKELDAALTEAKAAEDKAVQLFRAGEFTTAAQLLRFAYLTDTRPILLFNAGQAYRKAARAVEAKALYEEFLAAAPEHPLVPETRGYIKDMESYIAMQVRSQQVALALEEQLEATRNSEKQAAHRLEQEQRQSAQIRQALVHTQTQLERDRKKSAARRSLALGVGIGSTLLVGVVVGLTAGLIYNARASTDGGTALIAK